jgi:hypothetical protein
MRVLIGSLVGLVVVMSGVGCQTYQDDLTRSQRAFEQNEHEHALAIMRQLEPDNSHLSISEQAQYFYLRGMTDYRIGYKVDARHWLALAQAVADRTPGLLPDDWKVRMKEALGELNEGVYGGGLQSLANAKVKAGEVTEPAKTDAPSKGAPVPKSETDP